MPHSLTGLAIALFALGACRPELGDPAYPDWPRWRDPESLPGAFPWDGESPRLSVGYFHDSPDFTEQFPIDDVTAFYFIFSPPPDFTEPTYDDAFVDDRIEGRVSNEITPNGSQEWWGGGIVWEPRRDLSEWTTMHVALRATDALFAGTFIGMGNPGFEPSVPAADYGFVPDGEWHSLVIPLQDFVDLGVDLVDIRLAFSIGADKSTPGRPILVDDLYFTQEGNE